MTCNNIHNESTEPCLLLKQNTGDGHRKSVLFIENEEKAEVILETNEVKDPDFDGGYGWAVVLGSFLSHLFLLGMVRSFGVLYIELLSIFNETAKETASMSSIFNTLRMVVAPLVSVFCKRFSCRTAMIIGSFGLCLALVMCSFATSLWHITLCYGVVGGLTSSLLFTPSYIMVGQYFEKKKGLAMSLGTIGAGLGAVAIAPLMVYLFRTYSLFGTMIILGGLQLHHCISGALFRPFHGKTSNGNKIILEATENIQEEKPMQREKNIFHKSEEDLFYSCQSHLDSEIKADDINGKEHLQLNKEDTNAISSSFGSENGKNKNEDEHKKLNGEIVENEEEKSQHSCLYRTKRSIKKKFLLLHSVTMWLYCLTISLMAIANGMVIFFASDATKQLGATDTQAALVLSFFSIFDVIGRLTWGVIFDFKVFRTRRRVLFSLLGLVCAVLVFLHGLMPNYYAIVVCACVFGLFEGGFHAQRMTIVTEFVEKDMLPETVGISIFFQGIGNIFGPLLGGYCKDTFGNYSPGYFISGSMQFIVCLLSLIYYAVGNKVSSYFRK